MKVNVKVKYDQNEVSEVDVLDFLLEASMSLIGTKFLSVSYNGNLVDYIIRFSSEKTNQEIQDFITKLNDDLKNVSNTPIVVSSVLSEDGDSDLWEVDKVGNHIGTGFKGGGNKSGGKKGRTWDTQKVAKSYEEIAKILQQTNPDDTKISAGYVKNIEEQAMRKIRASLMKPENRELRKLLHGAMIDLIWDEGSDSWKRK